MTKRFRTINIRQSSVENHPQKKLILDALLAGRPVREIEGWAIPKVGRMSLQRFRAQHVLPALRHASTVTSRLERNPVQKALRVAPDGGADAVDVARAEIQHRPVLTIRENRLAALQDRHERLKMIMYERAEEMKDLVPGGASGLLARDFKGGDQPVFRVDRALLTEFREHERATAIEMGEWRENLAPQMAIQIVMPSTTTPASQTEVDECVDIALSPRGRT